jgi:hypothetical protein
LWVLSDNLVFGGIDALFSLTFLIKGNSLERRPQKACFVFIALRNSSSSSRQILECLCLIETIFERDDFAKPGTNFSLACLGYS